MVNVVHVHKIRRGSRHGDGFEVEKEKVKEKAASEFIEIIEVLVPKEAIKRERWGKGKDGVFHGGLLVSFCIKVSPPCFF